MNFKRLIIYSLFLNFFLGPTGKSQGIPNTSSSILPDLDRIDPQFWWVGMKDPNLQLLVHGKNISERTIILHYPGILVKKIHKVENPNYLFLDLLISPETRPGTLSIHFIKKGSPEIRYAYSLKSREIQKGKAQGVTNKDLIYLIMPDRFSNGDPQNDSIMGMREIGINRNQMYKRHGGDIQGIIDHLNYLKDLGVTAIWLTPAIENDEPGYSYHGYAVTDHYKIDPRFGTNALYRELVKKSHAMGLKVIMDLVHNHAGTEGYTIRDMPMKDWVHEWPQYTQSNFQDQTLMDPYASADDRKYMLNGWFDKSMADLNEDNPFLQNFLTQNHIWWVEYSGVDGFRLDTYPYNDPLFMSKWAIRLSKEFPKLSIFGETNASNINNAFYAWGDKINRGLDTHLPGLTDVQLEGAIYDALNHNNQGVFSIYNILAQDFMYKDPSQNVVFMDNHDQSRFFSMVGENFNKFKAGLGILLTTRRIPQIYYGDEILMKNFSNPDGLVRSDFPGGWKGDSVNKFTEQGRNLKENESFRYIRTLANYRKNTPALQTGKMMQYIPRSGIYVYFRYDPSKTIMVIFNSNDEESRLDTKRFHERTQGFIQGLDIIEGNPYKLSDPIKIPGNTTLILELKK